MTEDVLGVLNLDKRRKLHMGVRAMRAIERELGDRFDKLLHEVMPEKIELGATDEVRFTAEGVAAGESLMKLDVNRLIVFCWAGCLKEDRELALEDFVELIDDHMEVRGANLGVLLLHHLSVALGEGAAEKKIPTLPKSMSERLNSGSSPVTSRSSVTPSS